MLRLRTILVVTLASAACGGGGGSSAEGGDGEHGAGGEEGAGGEGGGDIAVHVDAPEEQAMVVIDESGRIGFETNVRMELVTLPGTTGAAAEQFGMAVQAKMAEIRTCYDRAVASDPEVEGSLELVLATDTHGRVTTEIARAGFTGGRITQCVTALLRRLPRAGLPTASRIQLVLIASNTMAAGSREVREHREQQQGGTETP